MREPEWQKHADRIIYDQISNLKGALHWKTYEDLIYIRNKLNEVIYNLDLENIYDECRTGSISLESA